MERVGVRQLRQNLSVYLRRVGAGERFEVTEHGRLVAALVPLSDEMSALERLVQEGRLIPAVGRIEDLGPPPTPSPRQRVSVSEALEEMRAERLA